MVSQSTGRHGGPRTRVASRDETRRHLFAAAEHLFRRVGYHAATLEQVARDAGYTKGAVYSTFSSKLELFTEVVAQRAARRRGELDAILAAGLDAAVDGFARHVARSATSERDWWASVIELMTAVGRDPASRSAYSAHRSDTRALLGRLFTQVAARLGRVPALTEEEAGTVIMALSNGLTLEAMLDPERVGEEFILRAHRAVMEGMLRPRPSGKAP